MSAVEGQVEAAWHISSYSPSGGGNCVEAGPLTDGTGRIAVRHSHRPNGPTLIYPPAAWHAFLTTLKTPPP